MASLYTSNLLRIPRTLRVVAEAWMRAEGDLQTAISEETPFAGEEFITERFCGVLKKRLKEASQSKLVEHAFLADLEAAFPYADATKLLPKLADGLGARVRRHERHVEAKTGGDFGFAIIRPQIRQGFSEFIPSNYWRGLLAQAKLRQRESGKWGTFTPNQKRILPKRLEYLALLLYRYKRDTPGGLERFQWQLCNGFTWKQVSNWLSRDEFPSQEDSEEIINALGGAEIGTDDRKTIDNIILPAGQEVLVLEISWPGTRPPSPIPIKISNSTQVQYVKVRNL